MDKSNAKLDTINQEVLYLLKIPDATILDKVARASMLENFTKISTTTTLIQSHVDGNMVLLHQISAVGRYILNKVEEYFDLPGDGKAAMLIKFTSNAILHANEVEYPKWTTLSSITTEEGIDNKKEANKSHIFIMSALYIPPFLTKHLLPLNPPSTTHFFWKTN